MDSTEKTSNKKFETVPLKLSGGWSGKVLEYNDSRRTFSMDDWADCLSKPDTLFEQVEKILKTENQNCVAVKHFTAADSQLKTVIKRHQPEPTLRQFFRSFRVGKALRNFKIALKLLHCNIPVPKPFAAIQQRRNLHTSQSIYVTEYLQNSPVLYHFLAGQLPENPVDCFAVKKQLSYQIAVILAALHKNNLWYRDSKAYNFLVSKDSQNNYTVVLVDVDGIKPYFLRRRKQQFRTLWRLAASVMGITAVSRTDYLRTFLTYCNLIGLEDSQRRCAFGQIADAAKIKYRHDMPKVLAEE